MQSGMLEVPRSYVLPIKQTCRTNGPPCPARLTVQRQNSDESRPAVEQLPVSLLDTRAAAIMSGDEVADTPIVGLPDGVATSHFRAPAMHQTSLARKSSRRDRGLSLRSSLFTQHMVQLVKTEPTIMELEMKPSGHPRRASLNPLTAMLTLFPVVDQKLTRPIPRKLGDFWSAPSKQAIAVPTSPKHQQWLPNDASAYLPIKRVNRLWRYLLRVWSFVVHGDDERCSRGPGV